MDVVLVRYGEIGSKSEPVRSRMTHVLRQRIVDRLDYEKADYGKVKTDTGRIIVEDAGQEAADYLSDVPGVSSVSPALRTEAEISSIKKKAESLDVGDSFGVKANRAGEHDFSSPEVKEEVGAHIEEEKEAEVELDSPETWISIDIRHEDAYIFSEKLEGPDGFPVGSEDDLLALISGGIDSPVAAYETMCRGSDIVPVYFYNKPVSAEDHLIRFKSVLRELKKFHPSKKWYFYRVDMEEVNRELMEVERGRMVLHRKLMFLVAGEICEREGLEGMVTGESLGQKSSQTPSNLRMTSEAVDLPVHRPLLSWSKPEISAKARQLATFEEAKVASACSTLAPESPATSIREQELAELQSRVDLDRLSQKAADSIEKVEL